MGASLVNLLIKKTRKEQSRGINLSKTRMTLMYVDALINGRMLKRINSIMFLANPVCLITFTKANSEPRVMEMTEQELSQQGWGQKSTSVTWQPKGSVCALLESTSKMLTLTTAHPLFHPSLSWLSIMDWTSTLLFILFTSAKLSQCI